VCDVSRSFKEYGAMAVIGLGVGLSTNYYEVVSYIESGFAPYLNINTMRLIYDIGRLLTAMCYIGVVMLACKSGLLSWLQASLVALGKWR
jgi:uncharacterized protein